MSCRLIASIGGLEMSDSDVFVCDKPIKPQLRLVRREEDLSDWSDKVANLARLCGAKIYSHWLYDYRSETFCCEVTPSYDLRFITHEVDFGDDISSSSDVREFLADLVEGTGDEDCYIHCSAINNIPFPSPDHRLYRDYANPDYHDETEQSYEDLISDDLEYVRCNGGIYAGYYNLATSKTIYGEEFLERATNELPD